MWIELAPNWKRSLTLAHPLIQATGGFVAESESIGACVTLPITLHARAHAPHPRVVEVPGGVLINTSAANPGLAFVLREFTRAWAKSSVPIIVAFAAQSTRDWAEMAARLERIEGVGGIELHLNPTLDARDLMRATRAATELPILAQLDLDNARAIARDCIAAGANALVIARAPRGMAIVNGKTWHGRLYAPTVKPIALNALKDIADLKLDAPIIASGGIHSADDARDFLAAGAVAFQVDSAAWLDPRAVEQIAVGVNESSRINK